MKYTLAKLSKSKKKDGSSDWFVWFRFHNPDTKSMSLIKVRKGINRFKTEKEKKHHGILLATATNEKLKNNWSPFRSAEQSEYEGKTLLQCLREVQAIRDLGLKKRSADHYKHSINVLESFLHNKEIGPAMFTQLNAQEYSDYLMVKRKYTGGSHNNQISNMVTLFNELKKRKIITENPLIGISKKPVEVGTHLPFSDKEREKLKAYMTKNIPQLLIFCKFIFYCGIRPKELMERQAKHIDWELKKMQIDSFSAKNRKQLSTELPDRFFKELKVLYKDLDPQTYLFSRNLLPGPRPVHRNRATELHKEVLIKNKMDNMGHTMYAWKHSGAVAFIKAGGNPYALMRQYRHHSFEQTMDYLSSLGLTPNTEFTSKMTEF